MNKQPNKAANRISCEGTPSPASKHSIRSRFEREARNLTALDHPNVGALYDFQHDHPDLDALPEKTPNHLRHIIERCLVKDPRYRMRDIGEAWIQLKQGDSTQATNTGILQDKTIIRLRATFPANHQLATTLTPIAFSPDGKLIACVLKSSSGEQLYLRRLEELEFRPLPGTERGRGPVFSPNGKSLAFAQRHSLRVLSINDGSIRTIVDCKSSPVGLA